MSNGDEALGCLWQGVSVCPKPEAAPIPCSALPGVIETVPLTGDGVLAVGSVVSPHGGARVVGDGIEVVNGVVCGEQEGCSAVLAAARVPPTCQHRAADGTDRHNGCLWFPPPVLLPPITGCSTLGGARNTARRRQHSLQLWEANSRRSRSFSWKLTKVVSLLVRILASEKRFRSWGSC